MLAIRALARAMGPRPRPPQDPLIAALSATGSGETAFSGNSGASIFSAPKSAAPKTADDTEDPTAPLLSTGRRKPVRCCRQSRCRIAMWCVLALVLLMLVAGLLVWLVFLPRYAENLLAQTQLSVASAEMTRADNDGFYLSMNITLSDLPAGYACVAHQRS